MLHIYKASAGSGKTFTLAYEYIKMLLGQKMPDGSYRLSNSSRMENHRSILAVTFTNKATEEMKRRILHELAVLAKMEPGWEKPSPYISRLCEELSASPEQVQQASAAALKSLLMDFSYFNVSTIDAFFQVVLRTFAREAELLGNYELELDNNRAIEFGVNEMFSWLNTDPDAPGASRVVQWISNYLVQQLHLGKDIKLFNRSSRMHADFTKLITGISNDTFALHYDEIINYLRQTPQKLQQFSQALTQSVDDMLCAISTTSQAALNIIDIHSHIPGKVSTHLVNALTKYVGDPRAVCASGASKLPPQVAENIDKAYDKSRRTYFEKHGSVEELDSAILTACMAIVNNASLIKLYEQIRYSLFVLGLIDKVYEFIEKFREENNTILLSDTNSLLREIIGDADAPFVYERVGLWLRHFLIDEFQDTSRMQWLNIRPLLNESMAGDSDSLIIGDEKQCIYRFRDSDPTLLQCRVQEQFEGRTIISGMLPHENTNYRSAPEVVEFNNHLFAELAKISGAGPIYANVHQQLPDRATPCPGYVSVMPVEASTNDEFRAATLTRMAQEMERQLKSGYHYDEICVLVRNGKEGQYVISALMDIAATADAEDCEYPLLSKAGVISDDTMMLAESPAVKIIVSALRSMSDPTLALDPQENGQTEKKHKFHTRREMLDMLARFDNLSSQGVSPAEALDMAVSDTDSIGRLDSGMPAMECFNLPSLVENIIRQRISPDDCKEQNMYITAFQDVVCDYCATSTPDVGGFLKWWDASASRLSVSSPMDSQSIRVMTIHKAKGLEFKCTHIPFLSYELLKFKSHQWFLSEPLEGIDPGVMPPLIPIVPSTLLDRTPFAGQFGSIVREQLLDELNVLYVAFTRAGQELIATYRDNSDSVGSLFSKACGFLPQYASTVPGALVSGSPDTYPVRKAEQRTALDPHTSGTMIPYEVSDGAMVWQQTKVDFDPDSVEALARGTALHNVLALVKDASTVDKAVERAVRRHILPREHADEVRQLLEERVSRPDSARWFSGYKRLLRERTITDSNGEHFRADRVVWTADGHIDIIDYKFGAERPREYAAQVRNYMRMYNHLGHTGVRGYVWYVDSNRIVPVQLSKYAE